MTSKPRVVHVRQGTIAWHDFRAKHIGSSDAPVIVGESPYRSALDLYVERTTGAVEPDAFTARLFKIGHAMEPVILSLYAEETGHKVRKGRVLEDRMVPWLSASLDGETDDAIVEAKWSSSSRWRDGVPADVLVQVTHQMAVARVSACDVAVLSPRDFTIHRVPFDAGFWGGILALETRFMEDHLIPGIPPPPDASASSRAAIARLYPEDSGEMVPADAETTSLVERVLTRKAELEALTDELDGMENALRFLIGERTGIEGPRFRVTYKRAKDSQRIGWEEYAGNLERLIDQAILDEYDLKSLCTYTKPGTRRLLVSRTEEQG
jgi:putative phage-type endonuclease